VTLLAFAPIAEASTLDLDRLIPALVQVESNGNPRAVGDGGKALGALQIWSVVVVDVNRAHGTRYTHRDAFDPAKAEAICRAYLSIYATPRRLGRTPTMEDAARIWNGGPNGHRKSATEKYWQKVARVL
jgi:soluble lytic murein transglycosylase-like protein